MSGLEAISLALAVFPLVVSLLEHYQDGCEKIRDWVLFRREFTRLVNDLNREQIIFRQHVEGTLRAITDSEFEIMEMMEDPNDPRWRSESLTLRLKRKLCGDGEYENYLFSMASIRDNLGEMSDRLYRCESSWNPVGPAARKRDGIQKRFRRLQFSISRKRWQEQVVDLGRQIDRVNKLYVEAEALAPARQSRSSDAAHQGFKLARRQAFSLHKAISKAWACGCPDSHAFKLLLGRRTKPDSTDAQKHSFIVSFPLRPRAWTEPELVLGSEDSWRTFETSMLSPAESSFRPDGLFPPTEGSRSSVSATSGSSGPRLAPTAATSPSTASLPSVFSSGNLSSRRPASATTTSDVPGRIEDLCRTICAENVDGGAGYLEDGQGVRHVFHSSPPFPFTPNEASQVTNLEKVLSNGAERQKEGHRSGSTSTSGPVLSRRHRMSIALKLAYAILEVFPSPWLPNFCDKSSVRFFQSKDGRVLAEQPFVVCEAVREERQRPNSSAPDEDHSNALLGLGIVIMELWFGQTIESRSFWAKYCDGEGKETEYTRLMAALEWQKKAKDEAGVVFEEIVSRCIRGNFGLAAMNLDEVKCVGAVYDHVVKPLEGLLRYCWPAAQGGLDRLKLAF